MHENDCSRNAFSQSCFKLTFYLRFMLLVAFWHIFNMYMKQCIGKHIILHIKNAFVLFVGASLPLMDWRLGRIVTAPSAISSWWSTGEILEPQLSDPTHKR